MSEERRKDHRVKTPIIGLARNVTQSGELRAATLLDLSKGGFLMETGQKANLRDAIEFSVQGFTLLGEVIHYHQEGEKWLVGIKIECRLDDEQLREILEQF
jgi:hypothetical protein